LGKTVKENHKILPGNLLHFRSDVLLNLFLGLCIYEALVFSILAYKLRSFLSDSLGVFFVSSLFIYGFQKHFNLYYQFLCATLNICGSNVSFLYVLFASRINFFLDLCYDIFCPYP